MNKETEDALHMLLHCSLKNTEYETQFEQYKIVRNYITNLQKENKQLTEEIEEYKRIEQADLEAFNNYDSILTELKEWLDHKHNDYKVLYKMYGNPYFMVEEYEKILKKVQDLKKKYKLGDKENE